MFNININWTNLFLQKKHKKKSAKATADEEPSLMMEDHEVIEGDNTPLQSPRDDAPTMVNNIDAKPVENGDKV